ncbi:MAG: S8 family peptidase [Rhizobacter sp.]
MVVWSRIYTRGAVATVLSLSAWAACAASADGLIVKLKDAPTHERASRLGNAREQAAQSERLQRVLQTERMTEARTRPVGRDAQYLHFGRRLSGEEAQAMANRLRARDDVEWVEPNTRERLLQSSTAPNDPYFPYLAPNDLGQWWLRPQGESTGGQYESWGAPGVQNAWRLQTGRPSAVVAVLDTGIRPHADLAGRVLPGRDFVSELPYSNDGDGWDADPADPGDAVVAGECGTVDGLPDPIADQPSSWHGTIISGIVAAATNNHVGVAGVSWNGRVLPVRVAGKCGASVLDITDGMRWAAGLTVAGAPLNNNPARIINISFGGSAACGNLYQSTINELASLGVVVVAAAGNGARGVSRPASCNGVVGVAALARDGFKAAYSNFGPQVVVSTVGGDATADDGLLTLSNTGTTVPGTDSYDNVFGTSFATPVVSGVISLMLSANERLTVAQVISGLRATARPHVRSSTGVPFCSSADSGVCVCTTSTCGSGVLDAEGAVRYALAPPAAGGDGGGGALGPVWLAGLALAVWRLAVLRSRERALKPVRASRRE